MNHAVRTLLRFGFRLALEISTMSPTATAGSKRSASALKAIARISPPWASSTSKVKKRPACKGLSMAQHCTTPFSSSIARQKLDTQYNEVRHNNRMRSGLGQTHRRSSRRQCC